MDAVEEIPQLGVLLQNPDSDDDQSGIFWIDVREGSNMCSVTGLTIISLNINLILICTLIGLIVPAMFIIRWCWIKNHSRHVNVENSVEHPYLAQYHDPADKSLTDKPFTLYKKVYAVTKVKDLLHAVQNYLCTYSFKKIM